MKGNKSSGLYKRQTILIPEDFILHVVFAFNPVVLIFLKASVVKFLISDILNKVFCSAAWVLPH